MSYKIFIGIAILICCAMLLASEGDASFAFWRTSFIGLALWTVDHFSISGLICRSSCEGRKNVKART